MSWLCKTKTKACEKIAEYSNSKLKAYLQIGALIHGWQSVIHYIINKLFPICQHLKGSKHFVQIKFHIFFKHSNNKHYPYMQTLLNILLWFICYLVIKIRIGNRHFNIATVISKFSVTCYQICSNYAKCTKNTLHQYMREMNCVDSIF